MTDFVVKACIGLAILAFLPKFRTVNITVHMNGNPRCHKDEELSNCTLDAGLTAAQTSMGPVTITIQPGSYTLHNNTSCVYHNRSDIQIVGQDSPVVNCLPGTGCSFYECQNVSVDDVTFIGCGAIHNSTSRNFTDKNYSVMKYDVAIYFELCHNGTITNVNISHSNGIGLVFIASTGYTSVTDTWFISNTVAKGTAGGGGAYIEFPDSKPGDVLWANNITSLKVSDTISYMSYGIYEFINCHFINNSALDGGFSSMHIDHSKSDHYSFGRGGGLLVYFKGSANNNNILLTSCEFTTNQADLGAGTFISFSDKSHNNTVSINDTNFTNNECYKANILPGIIMEGGGAKVEFGRKTNKSVFLLHCSIFTNNSATRGGGISIYAKGTYHSNFRSNRAELMGCHFESNTAKIGAAIDFMVHLSTSQLEDTSIIPVLENCTYTRNGGFYKYLDGSEGATFGTVNVENMPVTFKGITLFNENVGSALLIQSSDVMFARRTTVNFTANTGRIGAGITMLGSSWVGVGNGTQLVFDSNTATEKGGAIYAEQTKVLYEAYSHTCFIRYFNSSIPPTEWNVRTNFSNNTAQHNPNSIFTTSILPCVWGTTFNSTLDYDIAQTFCNWKNWNFRSGNCSKEILTSAGFFNDSDGYSVMVFPGWEVSLPAIALDDLKQSITKETLFIVSGIDNNGTEVVLHHASDKIATITVHGYPGTTVNVALETVDDRNIYTNIEVSISPCPPGFMFNTILKSCVCSNSSFDHNVICHGAEHYAEIFIGYCISYGPVGKNRKNETTIARCQFTLNNGSVTRIPLSVFKLEKICDQYHRKGRFCGECQGGYGISVFSNTFKCVRCTNSSTDVIKYLASFILPTFIFILIIIFHIGVTSAPANGFIFFSQVITIPDEVLTVDSAWKVANPSVSHRQLTNLLMHPYRVWSLDFTSILNFDVCLKENLRVIDILGLRYVSALQPVIVLIITYTLIELHHRNCRVIVWLWKPFRLLCMRLRKNWQAKPSVIDAFATFILLSYAKFIRVSATLLAPSSVLDINGTVVETVVYYDPTLQFFHKKHLLYVVVAGFTLATFGALPPLLLLLYPFRWFQRCLSCSKLRSHALQAFLDAFQGCYKDGRNGGPDRRYFAGMYFVFRIIIFVTYTVTPSPVSLFTLLQVQYTIFMLTITLLRPYKKGFYNFLDASFFAILALTSSTNMYMYTKLLITKSTAELEYVFYPIYTLLFIPFLYMIVYVLYWLLMQSRWFQTHCIDRLKVKFQRYSEDSNQVLPDRLENPDRYENITSDNETIIEEDIPPPASERMALKEEMNMVTNYGTAATY